MTLNKILILASLPYLCFTAYDLWMHSHDRQVPRNEKIFHSIILPFVMLFLIAAVFGHTVLAIIALICAFPCMVIDELFYHQRLHIKERRIHYCAGASFVFFIGCWIWMI